MNSRMPVVVDQRPADERFDGDEDVIDLNDPKWGGGGDDPPEMDEAWCRKRLWEITKLLREQAEKIQPNALVISALGEEAGIVKVLMAKVAPNAKPTDVRKKRTDELPDDELAERVEELKAQGKL